MGNDRRRFLKKTVYGSLSLAFMRPLGLFSDAARRKDIIKEVKKRPKRELKLLYPKGCLDNLTQVARKFTELTGKAVHLKEGSLDSIAAELILKKQIGPS